MTELELTNLIPNVEYSFDVMERIPLKATTKTSEEKEETSGRYKLGKPQSINAQTLAHDHEFYVKSITPGEIDLFWEKASGDPSSYSVEYYRVFLLKCQA